jgi:hypothetical protein
MRNNWNFSHKITDRSEAFGKVDTTTTSNGTDYSARGKALREAHERREAEMRDGTVGGTGLPKGSAKLPK